MKKCTACKQEKRPDDFCADSSRWDGKSPKCRQCASALAAEYRHRNRDRILGRERAFNQAHPERVTAKSRKYYRSNTDAERQRSEAFRKSHLTYYREAEARRRAVQRQTQVAKIDYERIKQRDRMVCHICRRKVNDSELHFDHVIPLARGGPHTPDNIAVSHAACNRAKSARLMQLF